MSVLVIDKNFKAKFKEISFQNRATLIKELEAVIDLPQGHYIHAVLNRYYRKYPTVILDREMAKSILHTYFDKDGAFIVDYDEPYQGGYPKVKNLTINEDETYIDSKIIDAMNLNWYAYIDEMKSTYWKDEEKYKRFLALDVYRFFEERSPVNQRERFLFLALKSTTDEKDVDVKYKFFNVAEVIKYYISLIREFYPEFKLLKETSNKKVKRFGKEIGNNIYLGLYVDFSFLESELKMTYIELPKIKIEIFSQPLNGNVREEMYLKDQNELPIARINFYFIGNPIDHRIGTSSEDESILKKNLFFFSDIYAFYLRLYLKVIETNIKQIISVTDVTQEVNKGLN